MDLHCFKIIDVRWRIDSRGGRCLRISQSHCKSPAFHRILKSDWLQASGLAASQSILVQGSIPPDPKQPLAYLKGDLMSSKEYSTELISNVNFVKSAHFFIYVIKGQCHSLTFIRISPILDLEIWNFPSKFLLCPRQELTDFHDSQNQYSILF